MSKKKFAPEVLELTKELAELLHETDTTPVRQIRQIIQLCGTEFARALYKATVEIEDKGGMMLPDKSRRRTRGGVFFHLARLRLPTEQRRMIFPSYRDYVRVKEKTPLGIPLMVWNERIAIVQSLQPEQGEVQTMKIVLVGRPGNVEKRPEVVVTTMSFVPTTPNLPRGIPTPPTTPTLCTVYIAPKQWEKIEESMADPTDMMTVDGVATIDPETNSLAVFASTVRSEHLDAKMREEQKLASAQAKAAKAASSKSANAADGAPAKAKAPGHSAKKSRIGGGQGEAVAPATAVSLNPNLPRDIARKLNELYASASLFRQKVANIQSKPAGQQFGLEMTQKLLKNVEDEIAALEKKHMT